MRTSKVLGPRVDKNSALWNSFVIAHWQVRESRRTEFYTRNCAARDGHTILFVTKDGHVVEPQLGTFYIVSCPKIQCSFGER